VKQSFTNQCRINAPLKQLFEIERRYDKEWKTHFISLLCTEIKPNTDSNAISEQITICINNKKEAEEFLKTIKKVLRGIK
jgi:hypothetical protein